MSLAVVLLSTARLATTAPRGWLQARAGLPAIRCCADSASSPPPPPPAPLGDSRSTLKFEEEPHHEGAAKRAEALAAALEERGFDGDQLHALLHSPNFIGSSALRTYNSFVFPKSDAALWNAEKPGRLATIAQSISFLVREQRANDAAWLRNHDRAKSEADALGARYPLHLVLDNIRSAHNVGTLLRAAEASRIEHVHLCGITPTPPHPALLKTAMGSAEYVPHGHDGSTVRVVKALKQQGVAVYACETTAESVDLRRATLPRPLALVLGNELIGVDTEVLEECDGMLQIPTFGLKNSLNVASAGSVFIWEALRQWDAADGE